MAVIPTLFRCLVVAGLCCVVPSNAWSQSYNFTTLAGNAGYGNVDGPTNLARFDFPEGVVADTGGNLYVADTRNSTIRRIDPFGLVTTLAGLAGNTGSADGTGAAARFTYPQGIAVDSAGNVYVADTANSTIRNITPAGAVTTVAGSPGFVGSSNGTNALALFNFPSAIAVDNSGVLYVADTYNSTIRMITPSTTNWVVTTLAGSPNINAKVDGTNSSARFNQPSGIAVDNNGNLYIADTGNSAIRKITPTGTNWITTTIANLNSPGSISVGSGGNLYVAVSSDNTIRKLTSSGTNWIISLLAGSTGVAGSTDGTTAARFNFPHGITTATNGGVYVADSLNNTVRSITAAGVVSTLAGLAGGPGGLDGPQSQARFNAPRGLAVDAATNIYVADSQNNTIRRITPAGVITTLVGVATNLPGSNDGLGTNAAFNFPSAVAVDNNTNIYVADFNNNEIRKLMPSGNQWNVTTLAGRAGTVYYGAITNIVSGVTNISTALSSSSAFKNYSGTITNISGNTTNILIVITNVPFLTNVVSGHVQTNWLATNIFTLPLAPLSLDGIGTNALFHHPSGLALDTAGNLYVADGNTNGVRLLAPGGTVTTLTASQGAYTNGTGQLFYHSSSVAVDAAGNVYVADAFNSTIRKISQSGNVATIAGSPGLYGIADGTNADARFTSPVSLALDTQTNLYVADALSHTIRKIASFGPDWVVTTVGGWANAAGSADGAGPDARFNSPNGIAVDQAGNVYVADTDNNTIRMGQVAVTGTGPVTLQLSLAGQQIVLTWPASALGFQLESSPNVTAGGAWLPVTNQPVLAGANLVVTNDVAASAEFYRLHKP